MVAEVVYIGLIFTTETFYHCTMLRSFKIASIVAGSHGKLTESGGRIFHLGLTQKEIVFCLAENHDSIISERHLRRILKTLHLYCNKGYSDIGDVAVFTSNTLMISGSLYGYCWMRKKYEHHRIKA